MSVVIQEPTQVATNPVYQTNNPLYSVNGQATQAGVAELPMSQVPQTQVEPVQVNPTVPARFIPEEAVQLSSGVYVIFNKLNRSISTDLTIKTFNNVNLDKKGKLVSDNLSTKEQMNMAKSISDYHSTLIMQGVQLWGEVEDYKEEFDLPSNWLRMLFRTGLINDKYYDENDPDDVKFLFLRYYAFQSEDDWATLSQNTLNT